MRNNIKYQIYCILTVSYLSLGAGPCIQVTPLEKPTEPATKTETKLISQPPHVPKITGLALGTSHACALIDEGVKCWGNNNVGQLGDNSQKSSTTPVQVEGLNESVVEIAAGGDMTCAIQEERHHRRVKCWGKIDELTGSRPVPTLIQGLDAVKSVAVGKNHVCMATAGPDAPNQTLVYCLGNQPFGEIQRAAAGPFGGIPKGVAVDGVPVSWNFPADIPNQFLFSGENHTCAIIESAGRERIKCWGRTTLEFLEGEPEAQWTDIPFLVPRFGPVMDRVSSASLGRDHACAVLGGAVYCMGARTQGQLGSGADGHPAYHAILLSDLTSGVQTITSGSNFNCAIQSGTAKCWGASNLGQLGRRPGTYPGVGAIEHFGNQVEIIAASANNACAVEKNQIKCWGSISDDAPPVFTPEEVPGF